MGIEAQSFSANFGFSGMDNQGFFNLLQKQQHSQLQQMQHVSAFKNIDNDSSFFLRSVIERQSQEIDQYLNLQNERLRLCLQEQRKQQFAAMLHKIEAKTVVLLKQKDEEIAKASNRAMELEIFLRKLEMENHAWRRLADENESIVINLRNEIEQLRENYNNRFFNNDAPEDIEDAESCCDSEKTAEKIGESESIRTGKMPCRSCNSGESCVLFLPCRHLCSCPACDVFLSYCPICKMDKKGSIEILFS